jgi:hypothetical protein
MADVTRRRLLTAIAVGVPALALQRSFPFAAPGPLFEQVPMSRTGITWTHTNGRSPEYYLPETTGAGCAFLDYDNDGWMDIYLVNSGTCDFFKPKNPLRNALYRNNRDGTFTDVTERAGVAGGGYGMGAAVGDFNNDGFPDLLVTGYDRCILYRNNGNGTFTDVTKEAGIVTPGWASSAVWFDYDNDGRLDLFICRFVEYNAAANKFCGNEKSGERYYCIPSVYPATRSWLFHNNGDGTFTGVSEKTRVASVLGKAWGVVATDVNNDGWMDLFVANDTVPNFLFVNEQGRFAERGLEANVAYSADGRAPGMKSIQLISTRRMAGPLCHQRRSGDVFDISQRPRRHLRGSAPPWGSGKPYNERLGWIFDYDNDGNLDLFIANGHPDDQIEAHSASVTYREPLLLFHNNGKTLENMSGSAGPVFQVPLAARGLALGDFDNDGAVDVLIAVNNAPLLLRNRSAKGNHWLGLRLVGRKCNRDAVGACVTWRAGALQRSRLKTGGGSYLSSHDPRMVLGVAANTLIDRLEIRWPQPSGRVEVFTNLGVDRYITIVEGEGVRP